MASPPPEKSQFRSTLPPTFQPNRRLSHSRSQSQLQTSARAKLGPWAQWGHTSASLHGLETLKRPKLTHTVSLGEERRFNSEPLPAIPSILANKLSRGSRRLDGRLSQYGNPVPKPCMDIFGSKSPGDDMTKENETTRRVSRTHSSPETTTLPPPPPPDPPMTKSATKVMQRTGYDPTMEIREGKKSQQSSLHIVTDNSDSSGSIYSQEDGIDVPMAQQSQTIGSAPVSPMQQDEIDGQLSRKTSSNVSSPVISTPRSLVISPEYKERVSRFLQGHIDLEEPNVNQGLRYTTSLEDLIGHEIVNYGNQSSREYPLGNGVHQNDIALMPAPLAVPIKKSRQSYFCESPEEWEPRTPSAPFLAIEQQPSLQRPSTISFTSSMAPPSVNPSESNKPRKKDFSSGKHPLKSPFPFRSTPKTPDSPKGTGSSGSLSEKFSGALKRLSGGTKATPTERNGVIPNTSRSATGPDTPMPKKSGFMGIKGAPDVIQKGNEHFHEVVEKAKLKINRKERRKRELKNQIVVVGIMDQTPG